jgi:molybdenum cofactor cytidylyltransferase
MSAASDSRRIGVILAAGRGGRMGGKKQLTPWPIATGTIPLVAAAYDAIRSICDEMVVVLGHDADAVAGALGDRAFHRAESDPDAPMFESIRAGLQTALRVDSESTVVLQPGDHPEVETSTLSKLTAWSLKRPGLTIIPQHGGRGGHPVLIPSRICTLLLETDCPQGLAQFWVDHPELCRRVPIDDPTVVRDIDTPADLG